MIGKAVGTCYGMGFSVEDLVDGLDRVLRAFSSLEHGAFVNIPACTMDLPRWTAALVGTRGPGGAGRGDRFLRRGNHDVHQHSPGERPTDTSERNAAYGMIWCVHSVLCRAIRVPYFTGTVSPGTAARQHAFASIRYKSHTFRAQAHRHIYPNRSEQYEHDTARHERFTIL